MLKEFTASIQKQNFVPEQSGDVYDPDTRLKKEAMKKRVEARMAEKKTVSTPTSEFETVKRYSVEDLRNNPDKIYIFGDNTEGWGKGGQAIVRDEPNAFGISTKDSPTQFMSDDNFEANKAKIDADIAAIKADGRPIVFPEDGIGTGRADLQNKAPRTWAYLQKELNKLKGGGSLGAAKLNDPNVFDEVIEEYTPGSKFLDDFVKNIPGYIIVPFEQMIESGLRATGYKKAAAIAKNLVKWELYTFATSLGSNVIGRGEGALTSPRLAQAHLLLGNHEEFKKRAENIEEDMMKNSAAVGQPLMSAIIKAMPSYWLDEWLLKRNPEFAGWKEMFPQVATLKKGAEIGLGKLFGNGK